MASRTVQKIKFEFRAVVLVIRRQITSKAEGLPQSSRPDKVLYQMMIKNSFF